MAMDLEIEKEKDGRIDEGRGLGDGRRDDGFSRGLEMNLNMQQQ